MIWLPLPKKILVSFIIFEILFYVTATSKNIFCVKDGVKLVHLSAALEFYNRLIPLNEVWPRLSPKYFGKLLHIYQIRIVRIHLWKSGVCIAWGDLRSHYGKFHNFLISFVAISWQYIACSWRVEIYPEMVLFSWSQGPVPPNLGELTECISVLFANLNMFGGSNLLRKMGWNYPAGALYLYSRFKKFFPGKR